MVLGMGFFSTTAIVIIQDSVAWAQRGAATASNIFSRNLGSTLGATVLGAVLNYRLPHPAGGPGARAARRVLDGVRRGGAAPAPVAAGPAGGDLQPAARARRGVGGGTFR